RRSVREGRRRRLLGRGGVRERRLAPSRRRRGLLRDGLPRRRAADLAGGRRVGLGARLVAGGGGAGRPPHDRAVLLPPELDEAAHQERLPCGRLVEVEVPARLLRNEAGAERLPARVAAVLQAVPLVVVAV